MEIVKTDMKWYVIRTANAREKSVAERIEKEESGYLELATELSSDGMPLVLINPQLELLGNTIKSEEGCLSVPNEYRASVPRNEVVCLKALDLDGKEITLETDGILAICLQHEVDHLDGKLFIDYLSPLKQQRIRQKVEKLDRLRSRA